MSGSQGRRNVGPPQTMAWSALDHPAIQQQPSTDAQAAAEGDGVPEAGENAVPSAAASERKSRVGERGSRGLEDSSAARPAARSDAADSADGSESSAGALNGSLAAPVSSSAMDGGQEVSARFLTRQLCIAVLVCCASCSFLATCTASGCCTELFGTLQEVCQAAAGRGDARMGSSAPQTGTATLYG